MTGFAPADQVVALAAFACLAGVVLTGLQLRKGDTTRVGIRAKWAWWLTLAITGGSFLFLASRFLAADLSYQYVFFYTRTDLEWQWRLAGTWAGREGSLLLWATALAAIAAVLAWTHARQSSVDPEETRARTWTRLVLGIFLLAFLVAVVQQHTFQATSPNLLGGRPTGNGLNPTLQSGYILIHPPMMFTAYALATVPAAAVVAHLLSGTNRWSRVALVPSRLGWLLSTAAIGLGAMWAYYTLGFGGYWAWDPVEVANLLPWLALTVYLHAQLQHHRHGTYQVLGPFLGVLPFLLTLFSTISTRSGLWVSVHAFTDPTDTFDPDAAARLLGIMAKEPSLAFHIGLFLATLLIFLALWARRLALDNGTLPTVSRAIAATLAALAAWAFVAPASFLSALFDAAKWSTGGNVGYGMLAFTFLACVAGSAPALAKRDEPSRDPRRGLARIDLRSLAGFSVLALGLALLVLFLFHMAAVNGWTTAFYEARFPWLATPILLGLMVLQGLTYLGRRRSLLLATAAWGAAGLAAWFVPAHRGGAYLAVLAGALVLLSLDRTRRAAFAPGMPRRQKQAATLLWFGAILDLLFWLNPPATIGFGAWQWHPVWPIQPLLGAASLLALWLATRNLLAAPRAPRFTHLLVGALGAFWVAPALALASAALSPRMAAGSAGRNPLDAKARARLRQVGLYGVHMAMAVALLGYAPSTYFKEQVTGETKLGESLQVGGQQLTFTGATWTGATSGPAEWIHPSFDVTGGARPTGTIAGRLHWEAQAQSHFPLPATLRSWNGDLFVEAEAVHVAAGQPCTGSHADGLWIEAYKASVPGRVCSGAVLDAARIHAVILPGLGLLWLALTLGVASMAAMLFAERGVSTPRSRRRTD